MSGWINAASTTDDHRLMVKLAWKGPSGSLGTATPIDLRGPTGGWMHLSGTAVAPAGATSALAKIVVQRLDGTIHVDDFALIPQ